ncbi:hypothetical protein Tco_0994261, partial [Tanacetum coccineum]
ENDGVNEGVNNEDIEDEDVDIELDDNAELIFPYEVQGDKTLPHGGVSSNSKPPNAESSDSVSSNSESEEKEADVAPEDTFGTITQRPYGLLKVLERGRKQLLRRIWLRLVDEVGVGLLMEHDYGGNCQRPRRAWTGTRSPEA